LFVPVHTKSEILQETPREAKILLQAMEQLRPAISRSYYRRKSRCNLVALTTPEEAFLAEKGAPREQFDDGPRTAQQLHPPRVQEVDLARRADSAKDLGSGRELNYPSPLSFLTNIRAVG
jgi:hypothetical protein